MLCNDSFPRRRLSQYMITLLYTPNSYEDLMLKGWLINYGFCLPPLEHRIHDLRQNQMIIEVAALFLCLVATACGVAWLRLRDSKQRRSFDCKVVTLVGQESPLVRTLSNNYQSLSCCCSWLS